MDLYAPLEDGVTDKSFQIAILRGEQPPASSPRMSRDLLGSSAVQVALELFTACHAFLWQCAKLCLPVHVCSPYDLCVVNLGAC